MLTKKYAKDKKTCKVTFALPDEVNAYQCHVARRFHEMGKSPRENETLQDGNFKASVTLKAGKSYHFRYQLDGERWENDWAADAMRRRIR